MPVYVADILHHKEELLVTERDCEICGTTFNPNAEGSFILTCSYECAREKFLKGACNE